MREHNDDGRHYKNFPSCGEYFVHYEDPNFDHSQHDLECYLPDEHNCTLTGCQM